MMNAIDSMLTWFRNAISTPHELQQHLDRQYYTSSGGHVTTTSALRTPIVMACCRVLGEDIAQLPLETLKRTANGTEKADDHWLYALLKHRPNRWQTAFEWREMMMFYLLLRGNAYNFMVVVRDRANGGNKVTELIPIHPDNVEIEQNDDHSLTYTLTLVSGRQVKVGQDRVLHIRNTTLDGVVGLTPISLARDSISYAQELAQFGQEFFGRGAKPSGILSHPGKLSNEGRQNLRNGMESYANEKRAATLVLDEGMSYTPVTMTNQDAEFIESMKFSNEQIARFFKVPAHKVNILTDATYSNIEQQSLEYVTQSLMPWVKRIEGAIHRDIIEGLGLEDIKVKFNVTALLRGDSAARSAYYTAMLNNGTMSINEVRSLENLNTIGAGDVWLRPLNVNYVNEDGDVVVDNTPEPPPPEPEQPDEPEPPDEPEQPDEPEPSSGGANV